MEEAKLGGVNPEKPRPPLPGGPYLVVGLARSGQAAARLLAERGERVIGIDDASPAGAAGLEGLGVEIILDGGRGAELERVRCVVKSPGVPAEAPAIAAARRRGLTVIGELELSWRLLPNRFCAVTGTNGKTTVAELLGHVWRTAGEPVAVAGNVGTPLASLVGEIPADATVICEASSFQLEDTDAFAPECGVLLNVASDHLDRHRTLDDYLAAKLRLFANQGNDDVCVYNGSEPGLSGVDLGGCGRRVAFCDQPDDGDDCAAVVHHGLLELWGEPLLDLSELRLIGPHNAANAAAAAAGRGVAGDPARGDRRGAAELRRRPAPARAGRRDRRRALRQRLQGDQRRRRDRRPALVRRRRAGDPRRLAQGRRVRGARPRGRRALRSRLSDRRRRRAARGRPRAGVGGRGRAPPLRRARRGRAPPRPPTRAGEVVLLAPACASFDHYRDYEERGEHFRALVEELR